MASCFLELQKMNQDLESKLRDDFHSILNSMDKLSLSPAPHSLSPPPNPPTRTISTIHNPSFTIAAHSWLLENIANPYPSSTVKASLAQRYNCSLSVVNSWFINARRRMGWTALCRDHFNNCRADALDAAHRALAKEDLNRPLPPTVMHAFVSVKVAAEGLYSSTFSKSALAGELDAVVRDMTDQDTILVNGRKNREAGEMMEPELQNRVQSYSPSSDYSSSSSPVPPLDESLTDDSEEEEAVVSPPILAGRKRRLSCSESVYATALPTKRRRYLRSSLETCTSSSEKSMEHDQYSCSWPIPQISTSIPASPKRRLSDTDITGTPNGLHELIAGPRLQTVSDPLPLSTLESDRAIDEWFNNNFHDLFSLPLPVDVIAPDLSTQWEVELFNSYNIPQELQKQPFQSLNPPTADQALPSADLSALDSFLQSLDNGGFVPVREMFQTLRQITLGISRYAMGNMPRSSPKLRNQIE